MAESAKHYLITGATGFIGGHLCAHLLQRGDRVIALTRNTRRARRRLGDGVTAVESLGEIAPDQPVDAVINLAGENLVSGRWSPARKRKFIDSRIGTTDNLVAWIAEREQRPGVLVSGSAVGYYGDQGPKLLQECDEPRPGFSHSLCQHWEQSAQKAEELGLRVCLLRTGIVLGRDGGTLKKMLPAFRMGMGGRLGSGEQWLSWVHIIDLVRLIDFLANHATLTGPFNGTAPNPVTNAHFTAALAAQLRRPAVMHMPAVTLRLIFGELADELLLASQRVLPSTALEAGFEFQYPELEGALAQLLG